MELQWPGSYAARKNSRTGKTASRKAEVVLKQKYTLKRAGSSEREIAPSCLSSWTFCFLGWGVCQGYLACLQTFACFLCPPEGRRWLKAIDLISWPWFVPHTGASCLKSKEIGLSKRQKRNCRATWVGGGGMLGRSSLANYPASF